MSIQESQSSQTQVLDFSQSEYEEDEYDAVEDELDIAFQSSESVLSGARSVLLSKLKACPNGDFLVTDESYYSDNKWVLTEGNLIKFDSPLPGLNDLKRVIMFHLLPDYSPWGVGPRSHNTVHTVGYTFGAIEKYVFSDNRLNATAEHLRSIDATKLNEALEKSKNSGFVTTYPNVLFFIRTWLQLSAQRLIPDEFRLSVPLSLVITKERQADVAEHYRSTVGTYKPFGEKELAKLFEYALFWTEKALPALLKVRKVLIDEGVDKGHAKIKTQKSPRADFFTNALTVVIDGIEVMRPVVNYYERVPKGLTKLVTFWDITWIRPYAHALDCLRNAVFIWIAIITGARKRELALLTEDSIIFDEQSGEYSVRITRFKTTSDPNFNGKEDILPLPTFIGDFVRDYISLRDVRIFSKVKALFGNHNHARLGRTKSGHDAYTVIGRISAQLEQDLTMVGIHCHRFRKTIAEILINRDERNIDIIRLLFGHTSYAMTLRYIARNPYLVRGVVQAIENSFTNDFTAIISGLRSGVYAGARANELANKLASRETIFAGKMIRAEIHDYVSHLIRSGEPIYIHRTAVGAGTYCLATENLANQQKPPCIATRSLDEGCLPNPKNCHVECKNLIFLEPAKLALRQNVLFYSKVLASNSLNARSVSAITEKLLASERRYKELVARSASMKEIAEPVKRGL